MKAFALLIALCLCSTASADTYLLEVLSTRACAPCAKLKSDLHSPAIVKLLDAKQVTVRIEYIDTWSADRQADVAHIRVPTMRLYRGEVLNGRRFWHHVRSRTGYETAWDLCGFLEHAK